MTRAELALQLGAHLAAYSLPVVLSPLSAVIAPAVVVGNGSRLPTTVCWTKTWELTIIVGRLDAADVYDVDDTVADTFCHVVDLPGIVNTGSAGTATQTYGDVDYLTRTFTLTDHNLGSPSEVC